ncbi:uncharacterized protein B0T23DRAFT_136291 [Neurospora hispaniola]|uniref:Uncharacterized protein n=1 Tax=Neurospora hispaniola TaxID=588809 RepID=A0AAJ0I7G4_9PEZI|nr:hypothetical protein B0T23DRAFT_136291 [Neurospora hispaniola]
MSCLDQLTCSMGFREYIQIITLDRLALDDSVHIYLPWHAFVNLPATTWTWTCDTLAVQLVYPTPSQVIIFRGSRMPVLHRHPQIVMTRSALSLQSWILKKEEEEEGFIDSFDVGFFGSPFADLPLHAVDYPAYQSWRPL